MTINQCFDVNIVTVSPLFHSFFLEDVELAFSHTEDLQKIKLGIPDISFMKEYRRKKLNGRKFHHQQNVLSC